MRRLRYQVAVSLDGFIAGPDDDTSWIPMDPDIDFAALFAQFDTFLMGRRTWEQAGAMAGGGQVVVVSTTLDPDSHPTVTVVSDRIIEHVGALKEQPGKDIWLFGGGRLFRYLLAAGLVDTVEPAIVPVLLGRGTRFLPEPALRAPLVLTGHRVFATSGIVLLEYAVVPVATGDTTGSV
ncbi:MAG TPA: dihydrofolate reductase family protein [Microlunatus sp.]